MNILDVEIEDDNDADAKTVREYLKALLRRLWADGEQFSGKRPFGNSGWDYDIYRALVKAGAVSGKIDEYGDLVDFAEAEANRLVFEAIASLN